MPKQGPAHITSRLAQHFRRQLLAAWHQILKLTNCVYGTAKANKAEASSHCCRGWRQQVPFTNIYERQPLQYLGAASRCFRVLQDASKISRSSFNSCLGGCLAEGRKHQLDISKSQNDRLNIASGTPLEVFDVRGHKSFVFKLSLPAQWPMKGGRGGGPEARRACGSTGLLTGWVVTQSTVCCCACFLAFCLSFFAFLAAARAAACASSDTTC